MNGMARGETNTNKLPPCSIFLAIYDSNGEDDEEKRRRIKPWRGI